MLNSGAMALKVPIGFKYEEDADEIEQKPFVPEPIEDGGKKLALALGGLAVANLTTLLMANEFSLEKRYQKPQVQINTQKEEYINDEVELENAANDEDELEELEEFDEDELEAQIQSQISKNIFQSAAQSVTRNVKRYEKIIQNSSKASAHGFVAMRNRTYNPFV